MLAIPPPPSLAVRPEASALLSRSPDSVSPHNSDPKAIKHSKSNQNNQNRCNFRRHPSPSPPPPSTTSSSRLTPELNTIPADFRPGRLSPLDVISRIFPHQKRSVLDLVLQGCNGDVVKAIEHFLSLNDAMFLHHSHPNPPHPYPMLSDRRREMETNMSPILGSIKSAFTPLTSGIGLSPNPLLSSSRSAPLGPPPPPPLFANMFASSSSPYSREFGSSSLGPYPNAAAIHYLFHPTNAFANDPTATSVCPSGCSQCSSSMATAAAVMLQSRTDNSSPVSAFKEVRGTGVHETAVDLSTEAGSWRSSPASSRGSKCND